MIKVRLQRLPVQSYFQNVLSLLDGITAVVEVLLCLDTFPYTSEEIRVIKA